MVQSPSSSPLPVPRNYQSPQKRQPRPIRPIVQQHSAIYKIEIKRHRTQQYMQTDVVETLVDGDEDILPISMEMINYRPLFVISHDRVVFE